MENIVSVDAGGEGRGGDGGGAGADMGINGGSGSSGGKGAHTDGMSMASSPLLAYQF